MTKFRTVHQLNSNAPADIFGIDPETINIPALTFSLPFQLRKCGVETKLITGHVAPEIDHTLIRNIATAHKWLQMIKTG